MGKFRKFQTCEHVGDWWSVNIGSIGAIRLKGDRKISEFIGEYFTESNESIELQALISILLYLFWEKKLMKNLTNYN